MQRDTVPLPLFQRSPGPKVLAFPATRRRPFVVKNARHASRMTKRGADNWLAYILQKHRDRLSRLGVEPVAAEADVAALETALRVEMARLHTEWGAP